MIKSPTLKLLEQIIKAIDSHINTNGCTLRDRIYRLARQVETAEITDPSVIVQCLDDIVEEVNELMDLGVEADDLVKYAKKN